MVRQRARIANSRGDFLHHLRTRWLRESRAIEVEEQAVGNGQASQAGSIHVFRSMLEPILIGLSAVLWGGLWGYATLLIVLVNFKEQGSVYAYPMQVVLDRFVESLGLDWLKALHAMQLKPLRQISYALFGAVTLGVVWMLWVLG
ncbi:hypothetical protein [Synechococcus sp. H55.10]|uniref:hypothetical protein n=1 Tax=Synechococcus sp. H55.10 TaxID=2964503 RepID=UPI0039C6AB91